MPPIKPVYDAAFGSMHTSPRDRGAGCNIRSRPANNEWYCGLKRLPRRGTGSCRDRKLHPRAREAKLFGAQDGRASINLYQLIKA